MDERRVMGERLTYLHLPHLDADDLRFDPIHDAAHEAAASLPVLGTLLEVLAEQE